MIPKRNLLYIGNKLAAHGKPPTAIDLLSVKFQEEGFKVYASSSKLNKVSRLLDMISKTIRYRKTIDIALIDTYSTQNFYYAVVIGRLCRFLKIPYIPILHGGNLPNRLKNNKILSKQLFTNALTNVVPSQYLAEQFKTYGIHNLCHIPNTIEIENYKFLQRNKITAKLLWVRSFSEIYNPLLALEVVELLLKQGVEVSLCMVGPDKDGSLARCKKVAAELKLPITFTGMLKKEEWITLSKDYNIFINTTNFDNMPVSVMEAMALGLPVVSTNVGGLPFLINHENDGILVPSNNPAALVKAINKLTDDSALVKTLTNNARSKIEALDWQIVKHKWNSILR
ncbi:glycosyltransferase family 4 protein [Aequorivita sediminis]|uniref:glycosyltransferase family 4 protein n=1 Tax=Aequorivita sediminis TaxID=3073653 RepID=UPI0028AAC334|nr:glycosyltransferase family 4 protein [Aequorivita sp. F6058]